MDTIFLPISKDEFKNLITDTVDSCLYKSFLNNSHIENFTWFNLDQFQNYHPDKPAKATIYSWCSKRLVPFHKNGKKLRFLKTEIDAWLNKGKANTISEIQVEADAFLQTTNKKGGRNARP